MSSGYCKIIQWHITETICKEIYTYIIYIYACIYACSL